MHSDAHHRYAVFEIELDIVTRHLAGWAASGSLTASTPGKKCYDDSTIILSDY